MRIVPGRIAEVISQAAEICEFVESNGADNARLVQLSYAGSNCSGPGGQPGVTLEQLA